MLKTRIAGAFLIAAMPLALMSGAAADEAARAAQADNLAEVKAEGSETSQAVDMLELGDRLAAFALARGDAAMLLQAARVKATVPVREGEGSEEGAAAADGDKDGGLDLSVEALLDQAEVLAQGDEGLLAMVAEARGEAVATRGRVGGPASWVRVVEANSRWRLGSVNFRAGEPARVWLAGDGDTDLDLYVYDEHGNTICTGLSFSDRESCSWTPRWTGPFTIEVRNLGGVWNRFQLATN